MYGSRNMKSPVETYIWGLESTADDVRDKRMISKPLNHRHVETVLRNTAEFLRDIPVESAGCDIASEDVGENLDIVTLEDVRTELGRLLVVKESGFRYETILGCQPRMAHVFPHVCVWCALRPVEGDSNTFRFDVRVDFNLPIGVEVSSAVYFRGVTADAVGIAQKVSRLVEGKTWTRGEVVSALEV